jgi:hypothetical protein
MNLLIYLYNWNVEKCIKYPYALGDKIFYVDIHNDVLKFIEGVVVIIW